MLTLKEHKIEVPIRGTRVTIFAYTSDGDGTPIVGYHAGVQNHTAVIPLLNHFYQFGKKVVAYDLPGHGQSDVFPFENPTIDDYSAVDLAVRQQLGVEEYIGIGHSLGGILLAYAASKPDSKLAALCMINSIDVNPLTLPNLRNFRQECIEASKGYIGRGVPEYHKNPHWTDNDLIEKGFQTTPPKTVNHVLGMYKGYNGRGKIRVPTLIIHGKDDTLIKREYVEEMAREIPIHELVFVEGGHFAVNQHPERFIKELQVLERLVSR